MSSFDSTKPKRSKDESVVSSDEFESAFEAMLSRDEPAGAAASSKPASRTKSDDIFDVDEISQIFAPDEHESIEAEPIPEFGPGFDETAYLAEVTSSRAKVLSFEAPGAKPALPDEFGDVSDSLDDINAAMEALEDLEISSDELLTADAIGNPFIDKDGVNEENYNECYQQPDAEHQYDSDFNIDYFIEESFKEFTLRPSYLFRFAKRFKNTYLLVSTVFALVGFAYFAIFPVALVYVSFTGFNILNSPLSGTTTTWMVTLFGFTLLLFMMLWKLLDLDFAEPQGLVLDEENAQKLYDKLEACRQEFRIPKIHKIILTRRHELNVLKVPRFGIPIWSRNTLAIGYPLMQTLTTDCFDSALKRRLLQYSKRSNLWINWISNLRNIWVLYATSLKKRRHFLDLIHYCFFGAYAALFRGFAVYVSQRDELFADAKALQHCNDRDLIKAAAIIRITKAMLVQYYWPKLKKQIKEELIPPSQLKPYENMPAILRQLLSSDKTNTWFIRLAREARNEKTPDPAFSERMARMGYSKIFSPEAFDDNAAQHYFGEEHEEITVFMDELWALQVDREIFLKNLQKNELGIRLPSHVSIPSA